MRLKFKSISSVWISSILVITLFFALVACNSNQTTLEQQPVSSQENTKLTTETQSVERVIALNSLSADLIQRLDKTKLVGIPGSSLVNKNEQLKDLPQVTQGRMPPNLEKILTLKPDLVIGSAGFHDQAAKKLSELGIKTKLYDVDSWEDLNIITKDLAQAINADPEPLLEKYQSLLSQKLKTIPSTLVLVSLQPILSPNKNSWSGDMLTQFNISNLAADLQGDSVMQGYISLSAEKILQADPEILLVVETGDNTLDTFKSQPFWNQLKAVKNNQVYVFEYYGLINPGSVEAIEKASLTLQKIASKNQ